MSSIVTLETVQPRMLAAVRHSVAMGHVAAAFGPALDLVWAFLRTQPGLRTDGHNVFLYEHPKSRGEPMQVDFGVEVTKPFAPSGEVRPIETPAGEAAVALHIGPYDRLRETHQAIHAWISANGRALGGKSWEIYGDWNDDPRKVEVTVAYLLK